MIPTDQLEPLYHCRNGREGLTHGALKLSALCLNPMDYFKKRKECLRRKDHADTVAIGKRIYKNCMEGN